MIYLIHVAYCDLHTLVLIPLFIFIFSFPHLHLIPAFLALQKMSALANYLEEIKCSTLCVTVENL